MSIPTLKTYYDLETGQLSESLLAWVSFVEVQGSSAKVCVVFHYIPGKVKLTGHLVDLPATG